MKSRRERIVVTPHEAWAVVQCAFGNGFPKDEPLAESCCDKGLVEIYRFGPMIPEAGGRIAMIEPTRAGRRLAKKWRHDPRIMGGRA